MVFIVSRNTATCSNASGRPESEERVDVISSSGLSLVMRWLRSVIKGCLSAFFRKERHGKLTFSTAPSRTASFLARSCISNIWTLTLPAANSAVLSGNGVIVFLIVSVIDSKNSFKAGVTARQLII
jgi:hypothetical protein